MMKALRANARLIAIVIGVLVTIAILPIAYVQWKGAERIVPFNQVPTSTVAIVLGAGLRPDGTPSDALTDRLTVGANLYKTHKVGRILLTGDNGALHRDEITSMQTFIHQLGIATSTLMIDGEGYRTYESCKNAKQQLHIDHAIVVTQRFHLGRAVYLCESLGLDSYGVTSDLQPYRGIWVFAVRDIIASWKAWFDINILPPSSPVSPSV